MATISAVFPATGSLSSMALVETIQRQGWNASPASLTAQGNNNRQPVAAQTLQKAVDPWQHTDGPYAGKQNAIVRTTVAASAPVLKHPPYKAQRNEKQCPS